MIAGGLHTTYIYTWQNQHEECFLMEICNNADFLHNHSEYLSLLVQFLPNGNDKNV